MNEIFRMGFEILSRKSHKKTFFLPKMFCLVFYGSRVFISVLVVRGIIWRGATAQRNAALRTPQIIYQRAVRSVFRNLAYSGRNSLLTGSQSTYRTDKRRTKL